MGYRKIDPLLSSAWIDALHDQGLIPDGCVKVIIEANADRVVAIHYQVIGERGLLKWPPLAPSVSAIVTDPQGAA